METLKRSNHSHKGFFLCVPFLFLFILGLLIPELSYGECTTIEWNNIDWEAVNNTNNNQTQNPYYSQENYLVLDGYGADVWTGEDEYLAYYQDDLSGDWSVQVEVVSQKSTDRQNRSSKTLSNWAKSGIMVKNDISVSAEDNVSDSSLKYGYCIVAMTPGYGVLFQYDSNSDGYLDSSVTASVTSYPVWLKLEKSGTAFSAYYSTNGSTWSQIGSTVTISTANTVQDLGLFVTAHKTSGTDGNNRTEFSDFCLETVAPVTHTITASAGENGEIASAGTTVSAGTSVEFIVIDGYSQVFTIEPDTGYSIDSIKIDGTTLTLSGDDSEYTYTFEEVTGDHTISVSFTPLNYTINASVSSGGSISPSGSVSVDYNSSKEFLITPSTGYEISQVLVDSEDITSTIDESGGTYAFSSISSDHTIAVTFCKATYTITAITGANGSITPSGTETLDYGDSRTYTITPDDGYYATVSVDGETVVANSEETYSYSFSNVTSDHTIKAVFGASATVTEEIAGCETSVTSTDYSTGFTESDFKLENVSVDVATGYITLKTGSSAIDPDEIVIPFEQEVAVTFIYELAGYESDFGYILASDAVFDTNGKLAWTSIASSKKHVIYRNIHDEDDDGIFDKGTTSNTGYGNGTDFPESSETGIAGYDDGTGIAFVPDEDGTVTNKDMRKVLGTFEAGTELVFFLTADQDWNTTSTSGVFFTKKSWNPDTYTACTPNQGTSLTDCNSESQVSFNKSSNYFTKTYDLGKAMSGTSCSLEKGWLMQNAIDRLEDLYGIVLETDDTYEQCVKYGTQYEHVIVGAPPDDPNQWILGWEDMTGGGDADYNDLVFRIERKTGGMATLQSTAATALATGSYYTAATVEVYDYMPCEGGTTITYWLSIDGGETWVEITDDAWDSVYQYYPASGAIGTTDLKDSWSPGTPAYTYRIHRVDFAGLGMTGDTLIWKAQMQSEDEDCQPAIVNVALTGTVATNGTFSRSSPVVQTNMSYSGSYETPALSWTDKTILRGHLKATRVYDPADPDETDALEIWDAGSVLAARTASTRNIYYPNTTVTAVEDELLATGDGETTSFSGTLANSPVEAETLYITANEVKLHDAHTDVLYDYTGGTAGTGTINRFKGTYTITFDKAPASGVPVKASYSYYKTSSTLKEFNTSNITSKMLDLDDTYVIGDGFTYDLDGDGKFNGVSYQGSETSDDTDGDYLVGWVRGYSDGSSTQKEWLLGAVDHSTPAIQTPPGVPSWYYGTDITEEDRNSYDEFEESHATRRTIAYAGARDGMIHAFDAGNLLWGNNPETDYDEERGYFKWKTSGDSSSADYGDGSELWAFIPANLISRLKNNLLKAEDQAYVDASPTLADVTIDGKWRTILACAEGNGGDTVFVLDVTDPYNPTFLWEFGDPDLFRSRSSPSIGLGRIVYKGEPQWVAIFVSGKNSDSTEYPSLYIVSVEDGTLIERVYLDAVSAGKGGVPSGQPAIVDSDGNGYIDRLYIGTDKGYLYKVNLPDDPDSSFSDITNCVINTDFDYVDSDGVTQTVDSGSRYQPIYASPAVTIENTYSSTGEIEYNILVFFGTGDSPYYDEDINTSTTNYYFYVYVDDEAKGECGTSANLDWFYMLDAGERVWASAYSAAGQIYFGTSTAETEDPCEATAEGANEGKLYVFTTSGIKVTTIETGNITTTPIVEDEHVYFRTSDGVTSLGGSTYNNETKKVGVGTSEIISWEEISE